MSGSSITTTICVLTAEKYANWNYLKNPQGLCNAELTSTFCCILYAHTDIELYIDYIPLLHLRI